MFSRGATPLRDDLVWLAIIGGLVVSVVVAVRYGMRNEKTQAERIEALGQDIKAADDPVVMSSGQVKNVGWFSYGLNDRGYWHLQPGLRVYYAGKQLTKVYGDTRCMALLALACVARGIDELVIKGIYNKLGDPKLQGHYYGRAVDVVGPAGADIIHTLAGWGLEFHFDSQTDGFRYHVKDGAYLRGNFVKGHKDDHWHIELPIVNGVRRRFFLVFNVIQM